ncbi:MAG: transcription antitermination factor NusB [Myxococcota bacterium]
MSTSSPARLAAARALIAVEEGAHLDQALVAASVAGADRDLAWFLAYGVTRRRGEVDAALRPRLTRPLTGLDPAVRAVLRLGAFERLFARTRPHAAVHQAVEVMKAIGPKRASGLVNAVMRRVGPAKNLREAESHNLPDWLWERWVERYGAEAAAAWATEAAEPPPLFVVARDPEQPLAAEERPDELAPLPALAGVYRSGASSARVESWRGYEAGAWWIQDAAAVQMADLVQEAKGLHILDAFAAPGAKAFRLVSRGARVHAVDRDEDRLAKVREGAARLNLSVETTCHDWTSGTGALSPDYDVVLADAPCTALGTLRRHPEVRWRRQPADLEHLAKRQRSLLATVSQLVRPGGALVYAVCSPEPEEGAEVIADFVAAHPMFRVEATRETAPPTQGEDAHFGCRLRRAT